MSGNHVIETNAEQFDQDVIKQSYETPVVLDFWAAWCGPCRRLAPLLEKLAEEHAGAFRLVKADVDQLPQHAAAFGVEGIPAVYALRDGKVVDSFSGLLTEPQLKEWLASILPTEADQLLRRAADIETAAPAEAEGLFRQAIMLSPQSAEAKIGLARVLLAMGDASASRTVLEELEKRGFLEPEAEKVKAQLELGSHQVSSDKLATLEASLAAAPDNVPLKWELAEALLAAGKYDEGLRLALEVVEQSSGDLREAARSRMVDTFRVLGDEHPLTATFRRQLALALY
jgi:putative thioredoxin